MFDHRFGTNMGWKKDVIQPNEHYTLIHSSSNLSLRVPQVCFVDLARSRSAQGKIEPLLSGFDGSGSAAERIQCGGQWFPSADGKGGSQPCMIFSHETRPQHFLLAIVFILLGGLVGYYWDVTVAGLMWTVTIIMTVWLALTSLIQNTIQMIDADRDRYAERMKYLAALPKPEQVTVLRQVSPSEWKYDYLHLEPDRLYQIAQWCEQGKPFSSRAAGLVGKDAILSDPEFRSFKDEILSYGYIVPRSEKDDRQGYDWTDSGKQTMHEVIEAYERKQHNEPA